MYICLQSTSYHVQYMPLLFIIYTISYNIDHIHVYCTSHNVCSTQRTVKCTYVVFYRIYYLMYTRSLRIRWQLRNFLRKVNHPSRAWKSKFKGQRSARNLLRGSKGIYQRNMSSFSQGQSR